MSKNKKGFTIIEVVLVLAIAGLIFLMVFIALPALQRSQRNTRRRQDMARILSALNDYQSNNNGKMPKDATNLKAFIERYVDQGCTATVSDSNVTTAKCGDQFTDPDGTTYGMTYKGKLSTAATAGNGPTSSDQHVIFYYQNAICDPDSEDKVKYSKAGDNTVAIMYYLEGGAIYCGDNQ